MVKLVRHDGSALWVQMTRDEADQLELEPRQIVNVVARHSRTFD